MTCARGLKKTPIHPPTPLTQASDTHRNSLLTHIIPSAKHTVAALLALGAMGFANVAWAQIRIGQVAGFTGPVAAGVKEVTGGAPPAHAPKL